jgi:hypothetical protein
MVSRRHCKHLTSIAVANSAAADMRQDLKGNVLSRHGFWPTTGGKIAMEEVIDDLIEAGWAVLNSDFDQLAFMNWRRRALDCITGLGGPDHPYAQYFKSLVEESGQISLLTGTGILVAAKENVAGKQTCPAQTATNPRHRVRAIHERA